MAVQEQFYGRTAWVRRRERVVRRLFRTDTGSALVLLAAALAALVWINVDRASYEGVWRSRLAIVSDQKVSSPVRRSAAKARPPTVSVI